MATLTKHKPMTKRQAEKISLLLGYLEIEAEQHDLAAQFGACAEWKELNSLQASNLIQFLSFQHERAMAMQQMRRKMLYYGYQMGWDKGPGNLPGSHMCHGRINNWLLSDRSAHRKPLAELCYSELIESLSQFELVYKSFLNKQRKR